MYVTIAERNWFCNGGEQREPCSYPGHEGHAKADRGASPALCKDVADIANWIRYLI